MLPTKCPPDRVGCRVLGLCARSIQPFGPHPIGQPERAERLSRFDPIA